MPLLHFHSPLLLFYSFIEKLHLPVSFLSKIIFFILISAVSTAFLTCHKKEKGTSSSFTGSNQIEKDVSNESGKVVSDKVSSKASRADFFRFVPMKYMRLNGSKLPKGLNALTELRVRMTSGEYEPLAFIISAKEDLNNVQLRWSEISGSKGNMKNNVIDPYIVKIWYQAGIKNIDIKNKLLTQELLLKNEVLIKVDERIKTNFINVRHSSGEYEYIDVSTPDAVFPEGVTITDSKELLPFEIEEGTHKLVWLIIHPPSNQSPGEYRTKMEVFDKKGLIFEFPVVIEILPFQLSPSILLYGIYYHGYFDNVSKRAFHFTNKNETLYRAEMKDLKEHGIMYPTTYQILKHLHNDLRIRNEIGFPNDKLFSVGLKTGNSQSIMELNKLAGEIKNWQVKIKEYGYDTLFIYGIDEAKGEILRSQRPAWNAVHQTGAKVFVAGYYETFFDMGDMLNIAVIQGPLNPEQARLYHSRGQRILSYSNPQAGEENPEIYRRNFGLALWKAGYDGAMEYAYQKNYNNTWNDFDHHKYREENFVYPVSDGVISTIQWEGFREAVDDIKYLSTLLTRIEKLRSEGENTLSLEQWIKSIQPSDDLDKIRSEIIDKILSTY